MIQVRLKTHVRRIRTDNGAEFVNQNLHEYYEKVGISHETSVARSSQQNGVVERQNCTLIEADRIMLIYAKALLFLWAEAVTTVCYTQNHSIIRLHYNKTPYELLHDKLHDLSFFHAFGALCYLTNDREDLGKLQPKVDIAPKVITPIAEVVAPEPAASTGSPSSTIVDQDAPSPNTPLVEKSKLDEDLQGKPVDATLYRDMIGSLIYLTSSKPDLTYAVCLCAWYQVEKGIMELYFFRTEYQLAHIFTKPLPRERFNFLIEKLGFKSMSSDTLKRMTEEMDE
nr:integrase, catalytic region, zinc finger, CCHC-type, peptidase aspartic, catalytic [Tanacetum cinerariifolium]